MTEKKFIVVPTSQIEQALRIPALWAETIGDVKEAEQEAKKLALKHWKQYNDGRGESYTYTRTLVTGKGLAYIQKRLHGLQAGVSREFG